MRRYLHGALAFCVTASFSILATSAADRASTRGPLPTVVVEVKIKMPEQLSPSEANCEKQRELRLAPKRLSQGIENMEVLLPARSKAQITEVQKKYDALAASGDTARVNDFVVQPEYRLMGFRRSIAGLKADLTALDTPLLGVKQRIIILTDVRARIGDVMGYWLEFVKTPAGRTLPPAAVKRATQMIDEQDGISDDIRCWAFAIHELPLLGEPKR